MPAGMNGGVSRVLMTADAVGGVWPYAIELARGLAAAGTGIVLAVLGPSPTREQRDGLREIPTAELIDTGLPLDWTAQSETELARANAALAALVRDLAPDIVHLNSPALAFAESYAAPSVAVAHSCVSTWWRAMRSGPMPQDFAWRDAAMRRGLERADVVVAASRNFAAALRAAHGASFSIVVVPNGRSAMPASGNKWRHVFAAGRLWDEAKNTALLDRAAAGLDAPVLAAGPVCGPNGAAIGFDHLFALGPLGEAELARRYAEAPIFASPARYEPFGLAVLEAAQAGAALALSDIPTFRELWDGAAVFVAARDCEGWVQALQALLDSPTRTAELGELARRRSRRYSSRSMIDGTLAVYRRLLARRMSAAPRAA